MARGIYVGDRRPVHPLRKVDREGDVRMPMTRTPEDKYTSMRWRGRTREQIRAVAVAREDHALREFLKDAAACDALDAAISASAFA